MFACVFPPGRGRGGYATRVGSEMIGAVFSGVVDLKVLREHFWI